MNNIFLFQDISLGGIIGVRHSTLTYLLFHSHKKIVSEKGPFLLALV